MKHLGPAPHNAWRTDNGIVDLARQQPAPRHVVFDAEDSKLRIDLGATALIVVDMQKFFCAPGPMEDEATKVSYRPVAPLTQLIPDLRKASVPIIWVNWGNRPDEANLPPSVRYAFNRRRLDEPQPFLTKGTEATEIVDGLSAEPGDVHVDKYRLSGFWDTPLDSILRGRKINTLLVAGVNLDQCVYHTLADAHFLGYDCILLKDCAATTSPDYCVEATLYNVKGMGFVTESDALLAGMSPDR